MKKLTLIKMIKEEMIMTMKALDQLMIWQTRT